MIAEAEVVTVQISFSDTGEADEATLQGECAANGDLTCHEEALEEMKSNRQAIVERIFSLRDSSETIIRLLNVYDPSPDNAALEDVGFPRGYSETIRPVTEEWNRYICDLAEENGLPCADIYLAFNGPKGTRSPFRDCLLADDGQPCQQSSWDASTPQSAQSPRSSPSPPRWERCWWRRFRVVLCLHKGHGVAHHRLSFVTPRGLPANERGWTWCQSDQARSRTRKAPANRASPRVTSSRSPRLTSKSARTKHATAAMRRMVEIPIRLAMPSPFAGGRSTFFHPAEEFHLILCPGRAMVARLGGYVIP